MSEEDSNQDFSLAAPEDDDMDFDSSLPVEVCSDLKPRVIGGSERSDCVKIDATESVGVKEKKESIEMKETESIEVKKTLVTDDDIRKLWKLFDVPIDTDSTF